MPPIDAHQVLMTGENSFIRLSHDGGETMSDRTSHWRVLWCPAGSGHALFMQGELTDGEVHIYSDDISVARWLQRTIEVLLHPPFADEGVAVRPALFTREGDPRSTTVETIESDEHIVRMTWYDCIEPFILNVPPGAAGRPLGVLSTFIPARSAQLAVNDRAATGAPWRGAARRPRCPRARCSRGRSPGSSPETDRQRRDCAARHRPANVAGQLVTPHPAGILRPCARRLLLSRPQPAIRLRGRE